MNDWLLITIGLACVALFALGAGKSKWRSERREMVCTAYCLGPCAECDTQGITRAGSRTHEGVAVDPKHIPLGSRLDVPGVGSWLKADDTGGAIKGNRIDVRFATHSEAKRFGRKRLEVRVWTR